MASVNCVLTVLLMSSVRLIPKECSSFVDVVRLQCMYYEEAHNALTLAIPLAGCNACGH